MARLLTSYFFLTASLLFVGTAVTRADTFGSGENAFEIDFVTIGDPGNPADDLPNTRGAVDYEYRIGKYEISEQMIDKANVLGNLGITKDTRGPDKPATSVTWFEAAQFVNWLNTSSGFTPAYKFDDQGEYQVWEPEDAGYDPGNLFRNTLARYVLPSTDEWHKAAYYDPVADIYYDYPTGSDEVPDGIDFVGDTEFEAVFFDGAANAGPNTVTDVGLPSLFGTAGQGGNVDEWLETEFDFLNNTPSDDRTFRGGGWTSTQNRLFSLNRGDALPQFEASPLGFRVASIPEPSALLLVSIAVIARLGLYRKNAL